MLYDMIINFMGKIAVVTGGLAEARLFVAEGDHVAITGVTRRPYAGQ
jgi:NAD(P)-dependent dehydrogenase (short-subunit alcohol dehydrogenase family)